MAPATLELYVLPEHRDLGKRHVRPWGIDGRPALVGVRIRGSRGEVLLSTDGAHSAFWIGRAVERLERGEFGGITEYEAQRLRRARAADARIAYDRLALAAYRRHPLLSDFVVAHRPYTHHRGVLLDDPYCVLCGGAERPPFYLCDMLRSMVERHGLTGAVSGV